MFFAKKVSVYAIVSYFCAISLGVAADTTVTSKQYVDNQINTRAAATNKVNGAPLSNENSVFYGTSSTPAATSPKLVSIPAITQLDTGTVIVVKPTITSSKISAGMQLKLNDFTAYPIKWNTNAVGASYYDTVWVANTPRTFIFDGSAWVVSDMNTTYSAMSVAEGQTGTATSSRVVRADYLKQIIQYWANQEDASDLHLPVPTAAGKLLRSVSAANDTFEWAEFTPDYVTSSMLNDYLTITAAANTYQTKITSDNKLLSDLVDDTNQTHKFVTASEKSTWNAKQNAISDLATIRSGASAGATAVQPGDLADVATSGSYNDLTDKPTIPTDTNTTYTFAEGTTNGAFSVTPSGGSAQSVPVHGWADKEDVINKKNDIDAVWVAGLTSAQKAAYYPTVGAVHERLKNYALVNDLASKVDKVVAADKKRLISRNKDGLAGPAPSEDVDVADDGSFIVKHAVTADSATTAGSVPWTGVTGAPAIPTDTNTTYTFAEGTTNGAFSVTPSGGSAQSVPVHGWANKQDKITSISTSGTGSVVTAVTASNGTITATKGNVSYNDLTDTPTIPSAPGDIGAQPAGNYVTVAQGSGNASKAVVTDTNGDVTTGTIATDMIAANAVTSAKISDGTIVNADISSSAAIAQSKISGLTTDLASKMTTPTATATGDLLKATVSNGTTTWSAFTPSYASSSHNHPTSDVNLLTGYSKPNSTSALATTDTLNAALGKLETALDGKAASSHTHTSNQVTALTSYSKGTSAAALATTDTLNAALGKLENKADNAATTASGKWTKPSGSNKQMLQHNGTDWVAVTPDTTPTQNSTKPVESGGVYTALAGKAASNHDHDGTYVKKTESGTANQNKLMVRNGSGTEISGTSSDISLATANGVTTVTVTHATSADTATSAGTANSVAWANVTGKPTADETTLGIGKLYTSVGTETDGSMTQNAITDELNSKLSKNSADVQFVSDHEVDALAGLLTQGTDVEGNLKSLGMQIATNTSNITGLSGNKVNGALLSNANSVFYGTSSTAAGTAQKEVSISSITTLDTGTVIVVKPTLTSTAANGTIKLNDFAAKAMRYNNAAITTANAGLVWKANTASTWVYDGTYWQYVGPVYTASTGVSISNGAISNSGVRSVTNGAGGTVSSTAVDGSVAVNTNGTTTYPVVKGWDTKVDVGQGASKANMVLYTDSSGNVTPDSVKVPITDTNATGGWSYMWID